MYFWIVLALMVVLPSGSALSEYFRQPEAGLIAPVGKWFVFWAIGVRLSMAGLRQATNPDFTAEQIFKTSDDGAKKIVAELGFANISMGLIGLGSLWFSGWTVPAAVCGGLFLALDGIKHLGNSPRSGNENIAMLSDLFVAAVLAVFVLASIAG